MSAVVGLDARGKRLRAALAAVLVGDDRPEFRVIHEWLNSWAGVGLICDGMAHQGWDLQLTAYAASNWRGTFVPIGIAHSIVGGTGDERAPWRATQRAA